MIFQEIVEGEFLQQQLDNLNRSTLPLVPKEMQFASAASVSPRTADLPGDNSSRRPGLLCRSRLRVVRMDRLHRQAPV